MIGETRLHPLHSADMIAEWVKATGCYFPINMSTGQTTILALEIIAAAMRRPYTWISCEDHTKITLVNRCLAEMCGDMIQKLGLKHFTLRAEAIKFGLDRNEKEI